MGKNTRISLQRPNLRKSFHRESAAYAQATAERLYGLTEVVANIGMDEVEIHLAIGAM